MTVYKNRNNGVWLRGREHILDGAIVVDNARGVTFASEDTEARNSLFVGETANVGQPEPWMVNEGGVGEDGRTLPFPWEPDFPIRGFEFYDGTVGVVDSHFEGFAANSLREAGALSYLDFTAFAVSQRITQLALALVMGPSASTWPPAATQPTRPKAARMATARPFSWIWMVA